MTETTVELGGRRVSERIDRWSRDRLSVRQTEQFASRSLDAWQLEATLQSRLLDGGNLP